MRTIGLLAASTLQRGEIARAADQFTASPLFRRARAYAERYLDEWGVLHPAGPILMPQQVVSPGVARLAELTPEERHRWARAASAWLRDRCESTSEPLCFVVLAGYSTSRLLRVAAPFARFDTPLAGLIVAERIHWLDARLRVTSRVLRRVS